MIQIFNKIGLIFTFLSTTPLIWDLEHFTISPTMIHFPVLGHMYVWEKVTFINILNYWAKYITSLYVKTNWILRVSNTLFLNGYLKCKKSPCFPSFWDDLRHGIKGVLLFTKCFIGDRSLIILQGEGWGKIGKSGVPKTFRTPPLDRLKNVAPPPPFNGRKHFTRPPFSVAKTLSSRVKTTPKLVVHPPPPFGMANNFSAPFSEE